MPREQDEVIRVHFASVSFSDEQGSNDGAAANLPSFDAGYGVRRDWVFTDNASAHIAVPDDDSLSFTDNKFSLSVWTKIPSPLASGSVLYKGSGNTDREYMLTLQSSGKSQFRIFEFGDKLDFRTADTETKIFVADEWYHFVGVWDGSKLCIYLNGEKVSEESITVSMGSLTSTLHISTFGGSVLDFPGFLDEIRIYSRAITTDEIDTLYERDKEGAGH